MGGCRHDECILAGRSPRWEQKRGTGWGTLSNYWRKYSLTEVAGPSPPDNMGKGEKRRGKKVKITESSTTRTIARSKDGRSNPAEIRKKKRTTLPYWSVRRKKQGPKEKEGRLTAARRVEESIKTKSPPAVEKVLGQAW